MGLYKRNDTWCIQYFAQGRRLREAIGPSKREAQLVLGKRQAAIREGRYFDVERKPDIAFDVLCERYLKEYVEINKKPTSALRRAA
jgi:hypothetical protein